MDQRIANFLRYINTLTYILKKYYKVCLKVNILGAYQK